MQFCRFLAIMGSILSLSLTSPVTAVNLERLPERTIVQTSDGVKLVCDVYLPNKEHKSPAVILLHMLGHNRQTYTPLVRALIAQDLAVVTLDLRGHGESTERLHGTKISFKNFNEFDWGKLPSDVGKLIEKMQGFPGLDGTRIAIVGASIGANTAALVGASDNRVKAVVLLSAGLDYRGLKPAEAIKRFHRPVYVLSLIHI